MKKILITEYKDSGLIVLSGQIKKANTSNDEVLSGAPPPALVPGMIYGWGYNTNGQLGDFTQIDHSTPVSVVGARSYVAVAAGGHSLAIDSNGMVWAWGFGGTGELGNNNLSNNSSPVSIARSGSYISIAVGHSNGDTGSSFAIDSFGRVWVWGINDKGQLGTNNIVSRSSPVSIARSSSYTAVSAGSQITFFLDGNGSVWSCGIMKKGALGDGTQNDTGSKSSPVSIIRSGSYTYIAAKAYGGYAIDGSDGSLWAWGQNSFGELGDGTKNNRSSPVSV